MPTDRPDLMDKLPVRGEVPVRLEEPTPVEVTVRWSDLLVEHLRGVATHWAGEGDATVVHCRLSGCRHLTQIETWFPLADVRRT